MDFGTQNSQSVEIYIPPEHTLRNAIDIYQYLHDNRTARWILFVQAHQARTKSTDIIVVDHPLLSVPFFFHPFHTDRMFLSALKSRIESPTINDLYPV